MAEEEVVRVYTIPLGMEKGVPRTKRAQNAIYQIKRFIMRHMKADEDKVWIDPRLNEIIWERGIQKPPRKIKVRVIKFPDGLVEVSHAE
ncbi:MAG: 50S ribosomal protein L31e [Thermoplasmata archaeon]|nr:MAG: 50S ribosomal protein L31e [Thermoplasmata archaeon]